MVNNGKKTYCNTLVSKTPPPPCSITIGYKRLRTNLVNHFSEKEEIISQVDVPTKIYRNVGLLSFLTKIRFFISFSATLYLFNVRINHLGFFSLYRNGQITSYSGILRTIMELRHSTCVLIEYGFPILYSSTSKNCNRTPFFS